MHYDGCNVTWNLMLSRSCDYDGGGTYIRTLKKTVKVRELDYRDASYPLTPLFSLTLASPPPQLLQGQVLIHPGELFHKGVDITRGTRYLAVCFVDGHDPEIQDTSNAKGDHDLWEKNTATYEGNVGGRGTA